MNFEQFSDLFVRNIEYLGELQYLAISKILFIKLMYRRRNYN